jgi:hypothetical protein
MPSSCRQKKEREMQRGADVISSDASYKPSVGTWGIYARPKNISKAYGGGRNITPADSAISAEEQAEFDASLKEQLAQFRRSAGLDVDPAVEAECNQLTEQGERASLCPIVPINGSSCGATVNLCTCIYTS